MVGSLLLLLGAVVLLALGVVGGSHLYLVGSIAASLLAAIALVVRSRHSIAGRAPAEAEAGYTVAEAETGYGVAGHEAGYALAGSAVVPAGAGRVSGHTADSAEPGASGSPAVPGNASDPGSRDPGSAHVADPGDADPGDGEPGDGEPGDGEPGDVAGSVRVEGEEPPDEPVAQQVSAEDAARVAGMSDDVLVIDGRPRYHRTGCVHLLARTSEPLPVHEAVELGFTPCGLCAPVTALLDAGRPGLTAPASRAE